MIFTVFALLLYKRSTIFAIFGSFAILKVLDLATLRYTEGWRSRDASLTYPSFSEVSAPLPGSVSQSVNLSINASAGHWVKGVGKWGVQVLSTSWQVRKLQDSVLFWRNDWEKQAERKKKKGSKKKERKKKKKDCSLYTQRYTAMCMLPISKPFATKHPNYRHWKVKLLGILFKAKLNAEVDIGVPGNFSRISRKYVYCLSLLLLIFQEIFLCVIGHLG